MFVSWNRDILYITVRRNDGKFQKAHIFGLAKSEFQCPSPLTVKSILIAHKMPTMLLTVPLGLHLQMTHLMELEKTQN